MKIVQINSVCGVGSTGRICTGIAEVAQRNGYECIIAYGRMDAPKKYKEISYHIESNFGVKIHALKSRLFGKTGTYSKKSTKRFLKWLDEYKPDILHLHNLHGYYINVPMLFDYIKERNIRIIWTLHDCWSFTGHCAYFDEDKCTKWQDGCSKCYDRKEYPKSFCDDSKPMHILKKQLFTGVNDMCIVTPSQWLADLVNKSFLNEYEIKVINNGIDLNTFKPSDSDFRSKYNSANKFILLGVASVWDSRKGLEVFIELSKRLDDKYQIVLVGVDNKTQKNLPENIIVIQRTESAAELAEIYSAADLFVNPTKLENFPTVNIESLACGTPVLTFQTGGSIEIIDESCGTSVKKNDVEALIDKIE
ncbi:MAG: glycosyltransferase, partial [Clostridia bacterium]|nr:glycosyltransferase [Clostridia bacterium]